MTGEIIQSFLVGLGFDVDESSFSKFNSSLTSAAVRVTAAYGSIVAAASGVFYGISKVSEDFEKMGYEYHLIAPAINKALMLRRELLKAYSAAGINITKVVGDSLQLNLSLTKTRYAFEAIYKSVASRFFTLLTKQSDLFRSKLYENLPKIQEVLERIITFIFKAFDAVVQIGTTLFGLLARVFGIFVSLHKATGGWSTIILAVVAAWKLLNLAFLATPLGLVLAGLVAILALYDDFKVYKEGGKSFFNWAEILPGIEAFTKALLDIKSFFGSEAGALGNFITSLVQFFSGDFSGAFDSMKKAGDNVIEMLQKMWAIVKGLSAAYDNLAWAGGKIALNLFNKATGKHLELPKQSVFGGPTELPNSQTNQNVSQQTTINVNGSPTANATAIGAQVASQQGAVNFDMARNFNSIVKKGGAVE